MGGWREGKGKGGTSRTLRELDENSGVSPSLLSLLPSLALPRSPPFFLLRKRLWRSSIACCWGRSASAHYIYNYIYNNIIIGGGHGARASPAAGGGAPAPHRRRGPRTRPAHPTQLRGVGMGGGGFSLSLLRMRVQWRIAARAGGDDVCVGVDGGGGGGCGRSSGSSESSPSTSPRRLSPPPAAAAKAAAVAAGGVAREWSRLGCSTALQA